MTLLKWLLLILFYEVILAIKRKSTRRSTFATAAERARQTGKKLLVIGDPDGGFFNNLTGPDYTHGDVCIDLQGCSKADPTQTQVIKDKVEKILPRLDLSKYVIFTSCVYEYVEDFSTIEIALRDFPTEDFFVVNVEPYSLAAYIYPGYLLGDDSVPKRIFFPSTISDGRINFVYHDNPFSEWNKWIFTAIVFWMMTG